MCTKVGKLGNYVRIPKYINADFMRFLGFISGDGYSQKGETGRWGRNISFWNNSDYLQEQFKRLIKDLFGIECRQFKHSKGKGQMMQFSSSLVARIINKCGIPSGRKREIR